MFIKEGILYSENVSGKNLSTFRAGGKVKYVVYPKTISDIKKVITYSKLEGLPFFILGNGSNVLISDIGYNGVFICTKLMDKVSIAQNKVYVTSGVMIKNLFVKTLDRSLSGLEKLASIPSTIGGLIKGNSGAFDTDISSVIVDIDLLNLSTLEVVRKSKKDINFSYRSSNLDGYLIIGARLVLQSKPKDEIKKIYDSCLTIRNSSQPKESSLGCTFKNGKYKTGRLIDSLGLKGYSVGGAMVSTKHANFIVNTGLATATDYIKVMEKIESRVLSEYSINLEREIKIV